MKEIAAALCAALLLTFSDTSMRAATRAAEVFASGVMPALLPMMVLGRLLPVAGKGERSRFPWRAALFGLASGSPASAQRVRRLWDGGAADGLAAQRLLCATGVMSPLFFTGTLGAWTGGRAACAALLGAHWLSALVCALLWRPRAGGAARAQTPAETEPVSLPTAISQSAQALLGVCGAMMLFSIAAALLEKLLSLAFPAWTAAHARLMAVLWALLEIGGGAHAVVEAFPTPPWALLCALCSFGGLSIWLQNLLFTGPMIRPVKLLMMRALHGAVAYGICKLVFACFPAEAFSALASAGTAGGTLGPLYALWALYLCSLGCLKIQNLLMT